MAIKRNIFVRITVNHIKWDFGGQVQVAIAQ